MKKPIYQKQLLAGTSFAALAALSVMAVPSQAAAAWGTITTATTTQQQPGADGETLAVSGTGNVLVTSSPGAITVDKVSTFVTVDVTTTASGIASTGGYAAVTASDSGSISGITVTKGTLSSDAVAGATDVATVELVGIATNTAITVGANGNIVNTGTTGSSTAIWAASNTQTAATISLNNAGNITAVGHAGGTGIYASGVNVVGTNTGSITASETAIDIQGANTALNFVQAGGTITGNVVMGSSNTSTLTVAGGTIAGNVTMNQASQTLTLSGGTVNGNIEGKGTTLVTTDYTTLGNIGGTTGQDLIKVSDSKTLTLGAGHTASATNILVGTGASGATLNIGQGSVVKGALDAGSNSTSIINYTGTGTYSIVGNIGATNGFAQLNIASGTASATAATTIKADKITLQNASSTLNIGTGAVTGTITATTAGQGTVNYNGNQVSSTVIGGGNSIGTVNVGAGVSATQNANISATTVNVGAGSGLVLNTGNTITGSNVTIGSGGTFTQQTGATVTALVDGITAGSGTYLIAASGASAAFDTNNAIGSTNGLAAFIVGSGVSATIDQTVKATTVTIGQQAGGATGTLSAAVTGNVAVENASILNLSSGSSISGTINGASTTAEVGTVNVNANITLNSGLAGSGLSAVNVASGVALTLNGDLEAATTTLNGAGSLVAGNANRTIDGILVATQTSVLNAGTGTTTITGNLITDASSTMRVTVFGNTANQAGRIVTGGTATIGASTTAYLDVSSTTGYIASGTTYIIASGTGIGAATFAAVDNSAVLDFTIAVGGTTATATANRTNTYQALASGANAKAVGTILEGFGATTTAEITALQARLDAAPTAAAVEDILDEVTPQIQANSVQAMQSVGQSLDVVSARLSNLRAGIDNSLSYAGTNGNGKSGVTAGNTVQDRGIWFQAFGMTANQDRRNGVNGFDADTYGMAAGADMIVADYTRAGISVSYANTDLDAQDTTAIKNTDIDSYQVNLYGSHDLGQWYTDGLLGFAWQQFDSTRVIGSSRAKGSYNGNTYTARVSGGYRYDAGNGLQLIPNVGLTYFNNQIDGYTETGAGAFNLTVRDSDAQSLFGRLGLDLAHNYQYSGMIVRPVVRAAYLYDFLADEAQTTALFAGGGSSFRISDAQAARSSFNLGASLNIMNAGNVTFSADYDYLTRADYNAHSGILRARFGF